jgi:hypothetical protein
MLKWVVFRRLFRFIRYYVMMIDDNDTAIFLLIVDFFGFTSAVYSLVFLIPESELENIVMQ